MATSISLSKASSSLTNFRVSASGTQLLYDSANTVTAIVGNLTVRGSSRSLTHVSSGVALISGIPVVITDTGLIAVIDSVSYSNGVTNLSTQIQPVNIGNIYSKSTWTNLSDFASPTNGFSASGGQIIMPANNTYNGLTLNAPITMLDVCSARIRFVCNLSNTDVGVYIGFKSQNNTISNLSVWGGFSGGGNGVNSYKPFISDEYSAQNIFGATTIAFTAGDTIEVALSIDGSTVTCTCKNITTNGTAASATIDGALVLGASGAGHNTAKINIIHGVSSVNQALTLIEYSSTYPYNPNIAVVGDSITYGAFAGSKANRWAKRLAGNGVIMGGSGDKTREIVLRLPEIQNTVNPKKCYIMIGTNDIANGITSGVWQANIQAINSTLVNAGINVIWLSPPANNSFDMRPIRDYLATSFPTKYVDIYSATVGTGTALNSTFNADGTHPNAAGHTAIYNAVIASGL